MFGLWSLVGLLYCGGIWMSEVYRRGSWVVIVRVDWEGLSTVRRFIYIT